uniref:Uncharacterized protein n=1 Tax=Populus trichocarpa TaxID=3694 RepID=A9P9M8_POPTR|nr:unknown [Populus trichocarpa]
MFLFLFCRSMPAREGRREGVVPNPLVPWFSSGGRA